MSLRRSPSSLGSRLMAAVSQSAMVQLLGVRLDNLSGEVPQSSVTDLETDLAAKADATATTAALATKAAVADLASTDSAKGAALVYLPTGGTLAQRVGGAVALKELGSLDSPALATATLLAALIDYDHLIVNPGIYDPIEISQSNKTLVMQPGVTFRLPDGTVSSGDVDGPKVVEISGDNVRIIGDFAVDGNKAANDASSFPLGVFHGSLHVTGHFVRLEGEVSVNDAYWKGFYLGDSNVAGNESLGFYAKKIRVANPYQHSGQIWSAIGWRIDEFEMSAPSWDMGRDHRLRTGTSNGSTSICQGSIGVVRGNKYCSLVMEAKSTGITIPTVSVAGGGKIEDAVDCRIGLWDAYDCSAPIERSGFAMLNCVNCHVSTVNITDFDYLPGIDALAVAFVRPKACSVGSITSVGNKTNGDTSYELRIRGSDGLRLGQVILTSPVGSCNGFIYDHGYPPHRDIVVESLVSRGHSGWDVSIGDKAVITVRQVNPDAVPASPGTTANLYYPAINDKSFVADGVWSPTYTTSGADLDAVTYDSIRDGRYYKVGKLVMLSGTIRTDAITVGSATGTVRIGGFPFPAGTGANENPGAVAIGFASSFAGEMPIEGLVVPGESEADLFYRNAAGGGSVALELSDLATGGNSNLIRFSITYLTD